MCRSVPQIVVFVIRTIASVANRTGERAEELTQRFGGEARGEELE